MNLGQVLAKLSYASSTAPFFFFFLTPRALTLSNREVQGNQKLVCVPCCLLLCSHTCVSARLTCDLHLLFDYSQLHEYTPNGNHHDIIDLDAASSESCLDITLDLLLTAFGTILL